MCVMVKSKILKQTIAILSVVAVGMSIIPSDSVDAAPQSAKLNKKKLTIEAGSKYTLKVTGKKIKKIAWKSSKTKVAAVKKKGSKAAVITAKKAGSATISAVVKFSNNKKKTLKCTVKVKSAVEVTKAPVVSPVTVTPTAVAPTAVPNNTNPTPAPTQDVPAGPTPVPELDMNNLAVAEYPGIASDVPDLDIIRVGGNYYMVSTTMNLVPGVPIMKSTDLVNWEIVNYACNRFPDKELFNLKNGKQTYSNGSWAASLKYNEDTGLFYVIYNVNGDGFYCYTTDDIENGEWKAYFSNRSGGFHDPALIFDEDGMYVIFAGNKISKIYLEEPENEGEIGKVVEEGKERALFPQTLGGFENIKGQPNRAWSLWEGAHAYHIGDYYYLMIIGSYGEGWFRREVCYRSKKLYDSTPEDWEAQLIFEGSTYEYSTGIAQGGIVDTIYGDWYGFLFQDHDGLGRVPSILAVNWDYTDEDGKNYKDWPMMGFYNDNDEFVSCQGTNEKITKPLTIRLNKSDK